MFWLMPKLHDVFFFPFSEWPSNLEKVKRYTNGIYFHTTKLLKFRGIKKIKRHNQSYFFPSLSFAVIVTNTTSLVMGCTCVGECMKSILTCLCFHKPPTSGVFCSHSVPSYQSLNFWSKLLDNDPFQVLK